MKHKDKLTLHTCAVKARPVLHISGAQVRRLRKRMNLSLALFAHRLRTNVRTIENWEQGRAKPNAQAALLIKLVARYPDTVERLGRL